MVTRSSVRVPAGTAKRGLKPPTARMKLASSDQWRELSDPVMGTWTSGAVRRRRRRGCRRRGGPRRRRSDEIIVARAERHAAEHEQPRAGAELEDQGEIDGRVEQPACGRKQTDEIAALLAGKALATPDDSGALPTDRGGKSRVLRLSVRGRP